MSDYETTLNKIKQDIIAQKTIYKFRNFIYSMNKSIRHHCFDICDRFIRNEYQNNIEISVTEKERLMKLQNHWQWSIFEHNSTNWWEELSYNHSHSVTLIEMMNMWISDLEIFDQDKFENSTLGLR